MLKTVYKYAHSSGFLIFYNSVGSLENSKVNEHLFSSFYLRYNSAMYILVYIFL